MMRFKFLKKSLQTRHSASQVRYRERDRDGKEKLPNLPKLPKYTNRFSKNVGRLGREQRYRNRRLDGRFALRFHVALRVPKRIGLMLELPARLRFQTLPRTTAAFDAGARRAASHRIRLRPTRLTNLPKYSNRFWRDVPQSKHERRVSRDGGEMAPKADWHGTFQKRGVFAKRTQLKNVEAFWNE
jgi:hypothetical protein